MYIQGARQMFLTYIQSEGWIFTTGNRHGGVGEHNAQAEVEGVGSIPLVLNDARAEPQWGT